jgi:hypothetical protein
MAQTTPDSTHYKSRKLTLEEINFVSGYYMQDGNHSAVTGGVGTEELTDIATNIELKMSRYDRKQRKHSFSFSVGVDHYTSASSDKIDPSTITSASYQDNRIYPSLGWSVTNEEKKRTLGATASFSKEYDYMSFGLALNFSKASKDNNREFAAKLQGYYDLWSVILPIELRPMGGGGGDDDDDHDDYAQEPRQSIAGSFSFSQVVNRNLQVVLTTEPTYQFGLLATKYQRVYFNTGIVASETLPDSRIKIPLAIRASLFAGDRLILRPYYRFYKDDWGLTAHTMELETAVKLSPYFSVSPFYRFYTQSQSDYFAPYGKHPSTDAFFTSDFDLSRFQSQFYGAGLRIVPAKGIFGIASWNSVELRYGHYTRNNGLASDQLSLQLKWK